jgi:putative addiction module component (TIGR02574 family)
MDPKTRTVLDAALALPEDDRAAIAHTLLATLAPDVEEIDDEAFLAELERRSEEARRDPSATISWEELRDGLRAPENPR